VGGVELIARTLDLTAPRPKIP